MNGNGHPKTPTFWDRGELFSPPYIRLYAANRIKGHAVEKTDEEICRDSGLTLAQLHRICFSPSWDNITIGEMRAYLKGCDADFSKTGKCHQMKRLFHRSATFRHCHRSKNRDFYLKLFKIFEGEES